MGALAEADHLAGATHRIGELELEVLHVADDHLDVDEILEGGGMLVVTADGDHRGDNAFSLDAVETVAELIQKVDAGLLHEADIVGVMGDAHAVAFVIFYFVLVVVHGINSVQ